ncbi:acyl-CoA thioesterase [Temperatibacter marinus]|uniref:Acyl-CoA thioesterase n=1 Tax=Temperatibacter marinus TaxID=1456591 RepID=A0AA52EEN8_9PROT|nr:acyl-CoA thioesterase [Temperatibacter marinus]WND01698.1 acyl-CoA thioesterase [Temperatibacter marinus]
MSIIDREVTLRVSPMAADLNINGNIFGGWVLSQMDIAGGIEAAAVAKGPVATVAIESMQFISPINLGEVVSLYTKTIKKGKTSMVIKIDVYATSWHDHSEPRKVTEANFIFVAVDENGQKRQL